MALVERSRAAGATFADVLAWSRVARRWEARQKTEADAELEKSRKQLEKALFGVSAQELRESADIRKDVTSGVSRQLPAEGLGDDVVPEEVRDSVRRQVDEA